MKTWLGLTSIVAVVACGADPGAVGPLNDGSPGAGGKGAGAGGSVAAGAGGTPSAGAGGSAGTGGAAAGASGAAAASGAAGPGGAGGAGVGGGSGAAGSGGAVCDPATVVASVSGLAVSAVDLNGWAPYAIDGCRLLYVAAPEAGATNGALRLRTLPAGEEIEIAPAAESPRRPTLRGDVLAWETATSAASPQVRAKVGGGLATTLSGPFDHAGEPRAGDAGVAFTAWLTPDDLGDTDVYLLDPKTGAVSALATGPAQQRWADVSADTIAWSDFLEDPDGRYDNNEFDVCDVVLYDVAKTTRTAYPKIGKQGYPMVGSKGHVVYLDWPPDHPEPKNQEFRIRSWAYGDGSDMEIAHVLHFDSFYARPATRGGLVVWVSGSTDDHLTFGPVDGSPSTTVAVTASSLRAPAFADGFVVVAGFDPAATSPKLRVALSP